MLNKQFVVVARHPRTRRWYKMPINVTFLWRDRSEDSRHVRGASDLYRERSPLATLAVMKTASAILSRDAVTEQYSIWSRANRGPIGRY